MTWNHFVKLMIRFILSTAHLFETCLPELEWCISPWIYFNSKGTVIHCEISNDRKKLQLSKTINSINQKIAISSLIELTKMPNKMQYALFYDSLRFLFPWKIWWNSNDSFSAIPYWKSIQMDGLHTQMEIRIKRKSHIGLNE